MKTLRSARDFWSLAKKTAAEMDAEVSRTKSLYGDAYDGLFSELRAFFVERDPMGVGRIGRDSRKRLAGFYTWRTEATLGLLARAHSANEVRHMLYSDLRRSAHGQEDSRNVGDELEYTEIAERLWARMPPAVTTGTGRKRRQRPPRASPGEPHQRSTR